VIGVLFSFDPAERAKLDEAEGVGSGYEHAIVTVINEKGRRRKVLTYLATPDYIDDRLKPYGWYKDFVLANTACRRSISQNISSRLRRSKIPTRHGTRSKRRTRGDRRFSHLPAGARAAQVQRRDVQKQILGKWRPAEGQAV
jgi:hypothetical protein